MDGGKNSMLNVREDFTKNNVTFSIDALYNLPISISQMPVGVSKTKPNKDARLTS